jgi:hypothetical protein
MKQQISNIIIATILSGTVLYGLGTFEKKEMTYATVNFQGGFKKIGELSEQRTFSKMKVTMGNETIYSGDISKVTTEMQQALDDKKDKNLVTWKDGVRIKGDVGVSWIGSESSFELTTDSIDLVSTDAVPLKPAEIIAMLEKMDLHIKSQQQKYADNALTFSEKPKSSFLLSKLIASLRS